MVANGRRSEELRRGNHSTSPERIVQGHSIDSCGWRVIRGCSSSASSTDGTFSGSGRRQCPRRVAAAQRFFFPLVIIISQLFHQMI
ncbi:hypothetical protein CDAR_411121 [Caerostris darwini]|uniref:Uncharacterized protein n=1 Tax=Caerostris darwini TaxID=1538125 RepID=A0AAV4SHL0_9ARAC|nr:hypothetical protein CDAR_411121 [Caerostris darwini]